MRIAALLLGSALVLAGAAGELAAQDHRWGVSTDFGVIRFWGASRDASPDASPPLRPYRPTTFTLRLDRSFGRAGAAFGVQYSKPGIAIEGGELAVVAKGLYTWVQLAPEATLRLAELGSNSVHLFAGPVLDIWSPQGEARRTTAGAHAGVELRVPFSRAVAGLMRATGAVTGSAFRPEQLPDGFETATMSRVGVALGLRLGL